MARKGARVEPPATLEVLLTSTWLGVPQAPQVQTLSELAPPLGGALAVAKQYQVMALKALVQKLEELE